jgi:hypothetical protein
MKTGLAQEFKTAEAGACMMSASVGGIRLSILLGLCEKIVRLE